MDVAAIRKKAKAAKTTPQEEGSLPSSSQQNAPAFVPLEVSPASLSTDFPGDRLNDLFCALPESESKSAEFSGPSGQQEREEEEFRQYLTFSLGSEEYALDIADIREIIKPREITDIPRVPEFILGIISLRGIIIPIFDLKKRLNLGSITLTPMSRIVVCQLEDRIVGLLVDSITQVVRLPAGHIEPPPPVLSGLDRDLVEGVGRHQGRMMILLNLSCAMDAELVQ